MNSLSCAQLYIYFYCQYLVHMTMLLTCSDGHEWGIVVISHVIVLLAKV